MRPRRGVRSGLIEWSDQPAYVLHSPALVAVDAGQYPGRQQSRSAGRVGGPDRQRTVHHRTPASRPRFAADGIRPGTTAAARSIACRCVARDPRVERVARQQRPLTSLTPPPRTPGGSAHPVLPSGRSSSKWISSARGRRRSRPGRDTRRVASRRCRSWSSSANTSSTRRAGRRPRALASVSSSSNRSATAAVRC